MRPATAALLSFSVLSCGESVTILSSDASGAGGAPPGSSVAESVSASSTSGTSTSGHGGAATSTASGVAWSSASSGGSGGASSSASSSASGVGGGGHAGGASACTPGDEEACYDGPLGTEGVGACKGGKRTCTDAWSWGGCAGQVLPSKEICADDVDQDCDGVLQPASCCAGTTQCTDGIDNDGDALVDAWDPECHGPLDNDESSFHDGIPGDNIDPCRRDCGFDGNSGMGDDHCLWYAKCDPLSPIQTCPYDESFANCPAAQSPQCLERCGPLVPNGCDCFGCCDVFLPDGSARTVLLGYTETWACTYEDATSDAPQHCKACTKNPSCENPIEPCEYGLGKSVLPPECAPPATNGCAEGQAACTPTQPCPCGEYCLTGCCIPFPE